MPFTVNSRVIMANAERLYSAFTDARTLEQWFAPGDMTAKVHEFELKVGGGYQMSLFYPENHGNGKTSSNEDRYKARFTELNPYEHIIQEINFETNEENLKGTMIMEVNFRSVEDGTEVIIEFSDIPSGISLEDNEKGTELSLDKLEALMSKAN